MRKILLAILTLAVSSTGLLSEDARSKGVWRPGEASTYATRDASVLSIMGWGIGIAVGIATLFSLLDNNSTPHSGGGGHTH